MLSALGGGGLSTSSSSSAESSAKGGNIGDIRFGDRSYGLTFNPWTMLAVGAAVVLGIYFWKRK